MVKMGTWKIGVIVLAALAAKADTITTMDLRVWYGNVIEIKDGVLSLQATFPKSGAVLKFGAASIQTIEFNPIRYNPGAVPTLPKAIGGMLSGTVYTQDRKPHKCANITCDSRNVNCEGQKPETLPRQNVLRILIGR